MRAIIKETGDIIDAIKVTDNVYKINDEYYSKYPKNIRKHFDNIPHYYNESELDFKNELLKYYTPNKKKSKKSICIDF